MTPSDRVDLEAARFDALEAQQTLYALVLSVLDYASFREVSELTGISTNTLQRWKREAGK